MDERRDRLYELLPYIYRLRDSEQGYPLRELLRVIAEQVNHVEDNIAQLYDNWFIETAEDWAVPYIGDLVGYEAAYEAGEPSDVNDRSAQQRQRILTARADVANTVRYRRQRGTLPVLELIAQDVAGWPARAVEFYKLVGQTQSINHMRLERGRTVDIRRGDLLNEIEGPFDETAHTVDVRRINSWKTPGRYTFSNVGVFVWRLKVRQVKRTVAAMLDEKPNCFKFSILGNDVTLYLRPQTESDPTKIAKEWNLPVSIRRRAMDRWQKSGLLKEIYGEEEGKSLGIWAVYEKRTRKPQKGENAETITPTSPETLFISAEQIQVADLSDWHHTPKTPKGNEPPRVMVDPELGRIAFPEQGIKGKTLVEVQVMYHNAQCDDIGGGTYSRPLIEPRTPESSSLTYYRVAKFSDSATGFKSLTAALEQWTRDRQPPAVIEIGDSGVYEERLRISLGQGQTLQIRAANNERPIILIPEVSRSQLDAFMVEGEPLSRLTFDGLLIAARNVRIRGSAWAEDDEEDAPDEQAMSEIVFRHCTLVPGWLPAQEISEQSCPHQPEENSLELVDTGARIKIEHCIVGSIHVVQNEVLTDPIFIQISDSILDATNREFDAISGPNERPAHAVLHIQRSTIIGSVRTHAIDLAENSIFDGKVYVARRQHGCMRFCWYDVTDARVPRRFNCQPDLAEEVILTEYLANPANDSESWESVIAHERARVQPRFSSKRYGSPFYYQLDATCAEEIKTGADDLSELGVYHDLFQPQREANLRARLNAFVPAGVDAVVILVN